MPRFFAKDLSAGRLALSAGEGHHALHVLRLRVGAAVELFDGRGQTAAGRIAAIRRGEVAVEVQQVRPEPERGGPEVALAFAVPKGKRLDWLLEKATELGAASLRPVVFERSVAGGELTAAKRSRWLGHCISAAKQCRLDWLPELLDPLPLADYLATPLPPLRLLGDAATDARAMAELPARSPTADRRSSILVGPEGGLTDAERAACVSAGFVPVRLGRTVLRTETAAIALLAAAQALLEPPD